MGLRLCAAVALALVASGCDPVNNPAGFGIGITVIVLLSTIIPLVFVGLFLVKLFKGQADKAKLRAEGEPAVAQILNGSETGLSINDQPEVNFTLLVQRQGHPPYQAQTKAIISQFKLARVQVGMTVPVSVDRNDPTRVVLDLDRPMAQIMPPGMMAPGMVQPGMMQPGMMQPGAMQPGMMQPGMMQPGAMQPGMMQPGAMQPGMMQPGMMQPGMMQPGAMQPGMMQPGAMQPGMMQPGMAQPGAAPAGAVACSSCHQPVPAGAPFCPRCGAPTQPRS
jgi:hypothetical protein